MEEDEEEDIYAPDDGLGGNETTRADESRSTAIENVNRDDSLIAGGEEGEEAEEDTSDSDIDIITEQKDGLKPEPPPAQRVNAIKNEPRRTASPATSSKSLPPQTVKAEPPSKAGASRLGSSYPGIKTSTIDIDAKPVYDANGKPITEIDMDADFPEDDKPWRRPGTDITDYFNYGFDEFTWASYCLKQNSLRKEIIDQKKQMEDMQSFLGMPAAVPVPGMPGPTGTQSIIPPIGGAGEVPPEMQQLMQQMMAQGMDPSQMDFSTFAHMMSGGSGGMGGQGFGQQGQGQQQMGFAYGNSGAGTGTGAGAGNRNQGGRGQNRRGW